MAGESREPDARTEISWGSSVTRAVWGSGLLSVGTCNRAELAIYFAALALANSRLLPFRGTRVDPADFDDSDLLDLDVLFDEIDEVVGGVLEAVKGELIPWALGYRDPVRERVEAREATGE